MYTYITDITFHNELVAPLCDFYFVGDQQTKDALLFKGVPSSKIASAGFLSQNLFIAVFPKKIKEKRATLVDPVYKKIPIRKYVF